MAYDKPQINNTLDVITYANDVSSGWLINGFLVAAAIIIFSILRSQGVKTSHCLLVSTFLSTVFGIFFWFMGAITNQIVILMTVLTVLSFIYSAFDRE